MIETTWVSENATVITDCTKNEVFHKGFLQEM